MRTIYLSWKSWASTKSTSQKLKIAELSNLDQNQFQNIAHLLGRDFFKTILIILNDHISKNKNRRYRKNDFSFVSRHNTNFWTKKTALHEGGWGNICMSLTRTGLKKVFIVFLYQFIYFIYSMHKSIIVIKDIIVTKNKKYHNNSNKVIQLSNYKLTIQLCLQIIFLIGKITKI